MSAPEISRLPEHPETPAGLGFRMPAEWEPHEGTWLSWPRNQTTWPGERLGNIEQIYLDMMEILLRNEKVFLLVGDDREETDIRGELKKRGAVLERFFAFRRAAEDVWIRDYGPLFLKGPGGVKAWGKWDFNAWGGKYGDLKKDTSIFLGENLIPHRCFFPGMVLEGGSVEVNGAGICLTTEQCLLNGNRNPGLTREEIEKRLCDYLGVQEIVWLPGGVRGDDTDGHIDNLARFVAPDVIMAAGENDEKDANYAVLKKNWERLRAASGSRTKRFKLIKLPMPGSVESGRIRLPASYANFYIANAAVFLPVYDHKHDGRAKKILEEFFPGREIIPIPCRNLVYGLGSIHCITQQEPL